MKKANFTIRQFLAAFALLFCASGLMAQQTITRDFNPGAFNNEVGWEIIEVATNTVIDCEATGFPNASGTPVNYNVPLGTYEVRGFDCFGDSWNGGQLNVLQGGVTIFTTNGPPNGPLFPGGNTCNGIPSPGNGTNGTMGFFDVVAPCVVICPGNMDVDNTPGLCGAIVNFTIDDSSCNTPPTVDPPSGSEFPPGTTTVTATSGIAGCSFTITVTDAEPPTINCPADIVATLGPGECSTIIDYNVTGSDNCPFLIPGTPVQFPISFLPHGQGTVYSLQGNTAPGGVYFDVANNSADVLQVTGFGVRFGNPAFGAVNPPQTMQVFSSATFVGNETNAGVWTNLGPAVVTTIPPYFASGTGPLSQVVLTSGVDIPAGGKRGFHIWGATACPIFNYFNSTAPVTNGPFTVTGGPISFGMLSNLFQAGASSMPNIQVNYQQVTSAIPVQTAGTPSGTEYHIDPGFYENCFELTDINGLSSSCCFTITVNEYPNPTLALACNDNVQISLDEECSATIGADMILEGGPYGCYDTRYTVMVLSPVGQNLGNTVNSSYIGTTWTVKVIDNETGNSCWGSINVEDKLDPTIECRDVKIACNGELPTEPAPGITGPQTMVLEGLNDEIGNGVDVRTYDFDTPFPPGTPVQDVDIIITLVQHTWLPDLDIIAEASSGTQVDAFTVGGCFGQEFDIDVVWDDEGIGGITQCVDINAGGAHLQGFIAPGVQSNTILTALDGEDASGTWKVVVKDNFGGDWGIIQKVGLIITADAPQILPGDNCGPTTLDYVDSFTEGNCGGPSGTVVRTWTITDASGNSASCNQTITYDRPTLDDVAIPGDILWTCDQYNAFPNITDPTHLHPYITDTDLGTEVIDVNLDPNCDDDDQVLGNGTKDWPEVNSTNVANGGNGCPGDVLSFVPAPNSGLDDADVLALTGSGEPTVDGNPLDFICGIEVAHTDLYIEDCPGTFKILRKWTVIDWCANPVDVREINQVVKVADLVGPSINAPADLTVDVYNASFPQGSPHAICEGTFVIPAAGGISDNCSGVAGTTTELWTLDGQLLQSVDGNGGVFTSVPMFINGLPAQYNVVYYATDGCGNQGTDETLITLKDKVPPVAVCDEITEVSITNNGLNTGESCSTAYAADLDDGSYDNCKPVYFLMAKMDDSFSPNMFNRCYYPTRDFCCEDLGDNTVIVLVLDGDPTPFMTTLNSPSLGCDGTPGLFLSTGFSALNYNSCMVTVQVTDKLSPILISCPQNTRITCDTYADNYETGLTGLSSAEQCDYLTADFGAAEFWDNCSVNVTCNTNVNIDQCLEGTITRTWSAEDNAGNPGLQSCTQTIFVDNVSDWVVEFPADITVNCGTDVPDFGEPAIFFETCELVAVSYNDQVFTVVPDACYKIKRQWTVINWCAIGDDIDEETLEDPENALCLPFPACDLDGDGDCDDRTFRDSWSCGTYPGAGDATTNLGPDTDLDSNPWDGYITYEQIIKVIDNVDPVFTNGCDIPDVCILDNTCGATVLLPSPDIEECSINVTLSASGDLGDGFGPYVDVAPGTYDVTYNAIDNCNNQTDCHTTVTVVDCKKPVPYCKNGLVIELDPPADTIQVTVHAVDFNFASFDNCPGDLTFSFSSDVNDNSITYYCSDLGQQPVQMWVTDAAGNQDYCETFIIVQANLGQCNDDPLVAGATATEASDGVQGVSVGINSSNGVFTQNTVTDANGAYNFGGVPAGGDYTVTPALDENPLNGVSTFDLVLISKHILGVQTLDSPYKMIAADANKSNSVTTFDLVEIRKMILFINTEFPNNTSWRFVPKAYTFANPANPFAASFPEVISLNNLTADELAADFVAVKVGDVNGSAVTNLLGGSEDRTMVGDLVFNSDDVNMEAGELYTVDFNATDFNVSGYQFTLNFDKNTLEFQDVAAGLADASNFGLTMVDNGVITASWNSDEAKQLTTGDVVFSLTFKANESARLSDVLSINSRYTVAEAYNANNELMNVALSFNNTMVADGFALYQNTPNPFANNSTIGFYLPEATSATLTISDVQGKVVKVIDGDFAKGYNQVNLKRSSLGATGVLYYRLETATDSATRKMILVD